MPAYNAAKTLEKTVKDIPEGFADEIILVDDSSKREDVKEDCIGIKLLWP
jgi:glycosyltransferase involved in cell wall biosynthesis